MQINSWNCRGLGNPSKVEVVKDLLKLAPSKILLLQETKIEGESLLLIIKNKWNLNSGKTVSARGSCGGLATLCSDENFHLNKWYSTQHWIFTELFHYSSKSTFSLFNLYVLANIILAGDLNINLALNEKKGGNRGKDHLEDWEFHMVQSKGWGR